MSNSARKSIKQNLGTNFSDPKLTFSNKAYPATCASSEPLRGFFYVFPLIELKKNMPQIMFLSVLYNMWEEIHKNTCYRVQLYSMLTKRFEKVEQIGFGISVMSCRWQVRTNTDCGKLKKVEVAKKVRRTSYKLALYNCQHW